MSSNIAIPYSLVDNSKRVTYITRLSVRAISSVVEHLDHNQGVTGSNPVSPIINTSEYPLYNIYFMRKNKILSTEGTDKIY